MRERERERERKRALVASLLLVAMPGAPSSFLFLVVRPGAPSSVLAEYSKLVYFHLVRGICITGDICSCW